MRTLLELREETPLPFASRLLPCPDGSAHLMVMPETFWKQLDILIAEEYDLDLKGIIEFCFELAEDTVEQYGWDFDIALRELFMYYIYRNFSGYAAEKHNLANDNQDDVYTPSHD